MMKLCLLFFFFQAALSPWLCAKPVNTILTGGAGNSEGWTLAGPPVIDSAGNVAARLHYAGPPKGVSLVLFTDTSETTIASEGDRDPVTGAIFTKLSDPVASGSGGVAFIGALKTGWTGYPWDNDISSKNNAGVYLYHSGRLSQAAAKGEIAKTGSAFQPYVAFTSFDQLAVNDAGGVAFLGSVVGDGVKTSGFFGTDQSGILRLVLAKGSIGPSRAPRYTLFQPRPYVSGQSRSLDGASGNAVLIGNLYSPTTQTVGCFLSGTQGFTQSNLLSIGSQLPGLPGVTFKTINEPIVNANGSVAALVSFTGTGVNKSNGSGIWLQTGSSQGLLTRTGDRAPDAAGAASALVYSQLSDPVLNKNNRIAFVASVKLDPAGPVAKGNDTGIWSDWDGTMKLIAREGDLAPGCNGATFSAFK